MKDLYSAYTKDELWLIKEHEWSRGLQNIRESQFALGNGYLGTRGSLEEMPYDAQPGTYVAGAYDTIASQVSELVNLPNPVNFKISSKGEKVGLVAMDNLEHRRVLNMKKGLLLRHTLYQDTKKRRYDYQSLRFISMHNKNLGLMQIAFTPLDSSCLVDINTGIDTSIFNAGVLTEGRKKHFRLKELGQSKDAGFLVAEILGRKQPVVYWSGFYYQMGKKKIYAKDNVFRLKIKKGQTVIFTKTFCIKAFPPKEDHASYKKEAFKIFNKAFRGKFSQLLDGHIGSWEKLWKRADVRIEGTANIQQNLRFNIYHMLICGHYDNGVSSIGARTLSGEGYRGHVFWDAEIFLMPFYLFVCPQAAKNMLLYRFKRLDAARELAKKEGYKGAKFPWESAYSGYEETPAWAKNLDGTIIKIHTHKREHHITADIAYAVYQYYIATGDDKFMENCGYELLFESARFWVSRVERNKKKKRYDINNVIGPDEFHEDVNNNAFTNMMARWNIDTAYRMFLKVAKDRPLVYRRLTKKLNISQKEARSWQRTASRILMNVNSDKVIEQFEGYFKLKKILPTQTDENGMPLFPRGLRLKDVKNTQLIKQADVLMLLWLSADRINKKTKVANYRFYAPRTMHKSSLSPSTQALIACEMGDLRSAYTFFNVSLRTDISNLYGNTAQGIHAANLGGTWQIAVFGFAGVAIRRGNLFINPRMPRTWGKMVFSLTWRKSLLKLEVTNEMIKVKVVSPGKKKIALGVFNVLTTLESNKSYTFKCKACRYRREDYY